MKVAYMKVVSFSLEEGSKYFGRIDGKRFYIGSRVPYLDGKGLVTECNSRLTEIENILREKRIVTLPDRDAG